MDGGGTAANRSTGRRARPNWLTLQEVPQIVNQLARAGARRAGLASAFRQIVSGRGSVVQLAWRPRLLVRNCKSTFADCRERLSPVSNSYRMTPRLYTSVRLSTMQFAAGLFGRHIRQRAENCHPPSQAFRPDAPADQSPSGAAGRRRREEYRRLHVRWITPCRWRSPKHRQPRRPTPPFDEN